MSRIHASFRDPSGFLFERDGVLLRQVNEVYRAEYEGLSEDGGLFETLIDGEALIPHEEVDLPPEDASTGFRVLRPRRLPFVSHPYEWSFSQLKDAALLTLRVQRIAMDHGFSLKDASAYNVHFEGSHPIFIDTLSFERYREGAPWVAYRQFCRHFLAPLALAAYRDIRLAGLLQVGIDGIPLDLASDLLPGRTRWRFGLLTHLHLHAKFEGRHADSTGARAEKARRAKVGRMGLLGMIESLESSVRKLSWKPGPTEWGDYYADTNYTDAALDSKRRIVDAFAASARPSTIWDLGANTGVFTRAALEAAARATSGTRPYAVAFDVDPLATERNYARCREEGRRDLLPLVLDLRAPSPAIGWDNRERASLAERGPADLGLALALVHHLSISNNLPFPHVARFLHRVCAKLVIEFIPKSDSQVRRLLATRADVFDDYTQAAFEEAFRRFFRIEEAVAVESSERTLYLMTARNSDG